MARRSLQLYRIGKDENGVTAVEFALISPVFLFMLMGTFDIGYAIYMRSTLNGAIQLAARDSSLQDATDATARAAIDTKVTNVIQSINRDATVTVNRTNYEAYADVNRLEDYVDNNLNGTCDNNEPFDDANDNDTWDEVGASGIGGARDSVLYSITVSYDTLFPYSGYQRDASAKKVEGYETRTRNKYVTVPGEKRTIKLPVYSTELIRSDVMIRVPKFKMLALEDGTRKLPIYKKTIVQLPGNRSPTMEVPVYELVQTGFKKHVVPVTELVEVPRAGNPDGEVKMPMYEFVVATRNTGKNVVDYETVSVPVYVNVVTETAKGPRLRRVFLRNETIRRPKLDTKRAVTTGTQQYIQRKLVGYQTVSKPKTILTRKTTGYKTFMIPTVQRTLIGYKTVPRPTETVKREIIGWKTIIVKKSVPKADGFELVSVPSETLQRKLVGYKYVIKQMPPIKQLAGTEQYRVAVHSDTESTDASFNIKALKNRRTMTAQTLLKNQPYGDQTARTTSPGNCT